MSASAACLSSSLEVRRSTAMPRARLCASGVCALYPLALRFTTANSSMADKPEHRAADFRSGN